MSVFLSGASARGVGQNRHGQRRAHTRSSRHARESNEFPLNPARTERIVVARGGDIRPPHRRHSALQRTRGDRRREAPGERRNRIGRPCAHPAESSAGTVSGFSPSRQLSSCRPGSCGPPGTVARAMCARRGARRSGLSGRRTGPPGGSGGCRHAAPWCGPSIRQPGRP